MASDFFAAFAVFSHVLIALWVRVSVNKTGLSFETV